MIRFLVNSAVYMAAAAIGLVVADATLDGLTIEYPAGFVTATIIFGLTQAVMSPFFEKVTQKNASVLTGAVGLISAVFALFVTAAVSDSISIDGVSTWFVAALVIWLVSLVATLILTLTVAKRFVEKVKD